MTSDDSRDASAESLERLITLTPDPDRAERVRARCRRQLGRSRRPARATIAGFLWQVVAPLVVGGFCVLYAALLVATTLRFQG